MITPGMLPRRDKAMFPQRRGRRRWWGPGLSTRQKRVLDGLTAVAMAALVTGWTFSIAHSQERRSMPAPTEPVTPVQKLKRAVDTALLDRRAPTTAYIDDAALSFLDPLRGRSGKLQATFRQPGSDLGAAPGGALNAIIEGAERVPDDPGVYKLAVQLGKLKREVSDLSVITMVPFERKKDNKLGLYYIGSWPYESGGKPKTPAYAPPKGFIEVTRENKDTPVSEHFKLSDFLTKGQQDVWPKYLVLEPKLVDKLELIVIELERAGHPVKHVTVMSGFRTPHYNTSGGNTGGRASLSRHMYGDGSDVFVDNDRNGMMDDLNRDGKVDLNDAEVMGAAADRVDARHPALLGGVGIYKACCGHGPFVHIDTRGYRARWRGEGAG